MKVETPSASRARALARSDPVRAQAADDRRDAARDDVLDPDLRGARRRAAFAAPAQDMDVGIDEPGDDGLARGIDDPGPAAVHPEAPRRRDGLDDPAREEDVLRSERLGRIDAAAAYQGHHGRLLGRVTGLN